MVLDRSGPKPLYIQLEEILKQKIENQELLPHQAIPSENELGREFQLSRMTVRNVLTRLVNEGLLYRVPGKGTFVSKPKITTAPISQMGIREQLEQMGYETDTTVLDKRIAQASKKVATQLKIPVGSEVYVLERLRFEGNEPLSLHVSYIPASLCIGLIDKDIEGLPLCNILDSEYRIVARRGVETLETIAAGPREAQLLESRKGFPLLLLTYVMFSQEEIPFEYSEVIFRGDRIKLKFEFHR